MQITPTALAPSPAPQTASGKAAAPAEPRAFAKLLSAQQPPATPPAKPQRARADAAAPRPAADAAEASNTPAEPAAGAEPAAADDAASIAAEVLAALNPPAPTLPPLPAVPPQGAIPVPTDAEPLATDGAAPATEPAAAVGSRTRAHRHEPPPPHATDTAAATPIEFAESSQRAAEQGSTLHAEPAMQRLEARIELPRGLEPATALAPIAPQQRPEAAAAPVVALALPTPATAPEFREALGVQVSVLARDGVQHAELHLNPAEMGPISVQIALTGTQAQVDFGAESLATRQIIEAGLPELASALRDAGFTLTGGGVSQHPRGRSDGTAGDDAGPRSHRGRAGDAADPVAQRIATRLPQGAVDLYA